MTKTLVLAGLAAVTLSLGSALAQTHPPQVANPDPGPTGAETRPLPFLTEMPRTLLRGSKLIGVDVIGLDHRAIGEIEDVLVSGSGRVEAVVIDVGGFLGLGGKRVAVPFDTLSWNTGEVSRVTVPGTAAGGHGPAAVGTPGTPETTGSSAPSAGEPTRMPGANVGREALGVNVADQSATGNLPSRGATAAEQAQSAPGSTTSSAAPGAVTATVPVVSGDDGPERAMLRLTRADLERAPVFRYERE